MHEIEPFYNWQKYYLPYEDTKSPFFEKEEINQYRNTVYSYYLHPDWDEIGSETLYLKVLMVNYSLKYAVIELIGEWNDTLHNDVMYLKRNIVDVFLKQGIKHFVLIGENLFQFHGGEDDYYEEWFDEVEEGWIALVNFHEHVIKEFEKIHLDSYFVMGGELEEEDWRTMQPYDFYMKISNYVQKRLS